MKVTNNSSRHEEFRVVGGKPGAPKFEAVAPSETRDLDLADRDSAHNRGREAAGVITIGGQSAAKKAPQRRRARTPSSARVPENAPPSEPSTAS